ncbi:uncharacterized protein F4812DRAFT_468639 [Daldinia caldariorum]|uniref:uncharacterized protein n=1 Tax=Daldinia caldariorum TaxID=326644 RepID=UPI002007BE9E|nr:uncharacterized protein F4812DRAFT_468639 [Daldinia caldariorum]KAI1463559.1 hypothetical protein F4812DRAFT_468639 [Daldinia caldariorum]
MSHPAEYRTSYNYDNAAGVGFNRWEVPAFQHDTIEWHRRLSHEIGVSSATLYEAESTATSETFVLSRYPSKKRVRSLFDMAIRVVADNLATLKIGDLDGIPFQIAYGIWNILIDNNRPVPLQSFLVLATCLTKQHREYERERLMPRGLFQFNYTAELPFAKLPTYIKPLISHSFDFIVHLIFAHVHTTFSEHDFLALADLKNLGVLEIIQPSVPTITQFPRITDSIVRHWAEVPNPFPLLRVLRIWGYDSTTFRSLHYLNKFPSLAVYDVAGRPKDWDLRQQPQFLDPDWNWEEVSYYPRRMDDSIFKAFYERYPTPVCVPSWLMDSTRTHEEEDYDMPRIETQRVDIMRRDRIPFLSQAATLTPQQLDTMCAKVCLHHQAYMLYCQVGQSRSDKDLVAQGVSDADKAFVMGSQHVIPPRPYITIKFGSCCKPVCQRWDWTKPPHPRMACTCASYTNASDMDRFTFVRKKNGTGKRQRQSSSGSGSFGKGGPPNKPDSGPRLRKKIRKFSLGDL